MVFNKILSFFKNDKKSKKRVLKRKPLKKANKKIKAKKPLKKAQKKAVKIIKRPQSKIKIKSSKKALKSSKKNKLIVNKPVAVVTHYFSNLNVVVLKLKSDLSIGDKLNFKGSTTDFNQKVSSMQKDHKPLLKAKKGQEIGLKVSKKVRPNDSVYKI